MGFLSFYKPKNHSLDQGFGLKECVIAARHLCLLSPLLRKKTRVHALNQTIMYSYVHSAGRNMLTKSVGVTWFFCNSKLHLHGVARHLPQDKLSSTPGEMASPPSTIRIFKGMGCPNIGIGTPNNTPNLSAEGC